MLVRPFDDNDQWLEPLFMEFGSTGLGEAQDYGFNLILHDARVKGVWISGVLDRYWPTKGRREAPRLLDLGVYERATHTPNAGNYYVWLLGYQGVPLESEGPYGPYDLKRGSEFARIGARNGDHDRVVSYGKDPNASSFAIARRYRRGTGERII